MVRAIARHRSGAAYVVSIILRLCDWQSTPIRDFRVFPMEAEPVISWNNDDDAFSLIVENIRLLVDEIQTLAERKAMWQRPLECEKLVALVHRYAHGMRNEMHVCLRRLYRLIQRACIFLTGDLSYLCLMKAGKF
jgi:hypothetical protein